MTSDDLARLGDWLRVHVDGARSSDLPVLQPLAGGQSNPTYRLDLGGRRLVLRRKPAGAVLASAHAVDREYRVMRALAGSAVPVPTMHAHCDDASVIGSPFYLMDFVAGRSFLDPSLPGLAPAERGAIYDEMNRVIAALHALDPAAIGLADYGRQGGYLQRQVERWTRQYRASETERIDAMERLIDWLPAHLPASDESRLVHGDFRIDNLIFDAREPRVIAVLDWELSTIGHPLADFAYHAMIWRVSPSEFRGLRGHDLQTLGIPDEAAYVEAYARRSGRGPIADWDFYLAFNMFRMAAILQGIFSRAQQGSAAAADALETGRRARPMADAAWRQVMASQGRLG